MIETKTANERPITSGGYDAKELAAQSWADTLTYAHKQRKANAEAHFGVWGDQADEKLKEQYDEAVKMTTPPPPPAPPAKTEGEGKEGKKPSA